MFIYNVFPTFIIKRLINGMHKMFLKHSVTMVFIIIFFLPLLYVSFQMFAKSKNVYWDLSWRKEFIVTQGRGNFFMGRMN